METAFKVIARGVEATVNCARLGMVLVSPRLQIQEFGTTDSNKETDETTEG